MTEKPFLLTMRVVWWMKIIQIIFALPFTFGVIAILLGFFQGYSASLGTFLFFACLAYLGWANAFSTIQISDKSVTVNVFYGRFRIAWDEVEQVIVNRPFIALIGKGKRLVLSLAFAGRDAEKMLGFFSQQIEQRQISFEQNGTPFPLTHQNARIWR